MSFLKNRSCTIFENFSAVCDFNNFETYCIESEKYPAMVAYHENMVNKTTCDAEFETRVRQRATEIQANEMNDLTDGQQEIDDPNNAIQGEIIDRVADAMEDLVNANRQLLESITSEELSNDFNSLNLDQKRIVEQILRNFFSVKSKVLRRGQRPNIRNNFFSF
jgi:hypothetical protein